MVKLKSYWYRVYGAGSKVGNYRRRTVVVYRRITWLNPEPAFRDALLLHFKHMKQVSYNPVTVRLYLYSQFRRWETVWKLDPDKPMGAFYERAFAGDRTSEQQWHRNTDDHQSTTRFERQVQTPRLRTKLHYP